MAQQTLQRLHCDAFLAANADRAVHKLPHRFSRTPLAELGAADDATIVRRLTASLVTRQTSFDVWATLARLDVLLSDFRRLAPRFSFEQLSGQASVAAGNEYRYTLYDPAALTRLEAACGELSGEDRSGALGGSRAMDVRIARAGPWGGETGELVVEALSNHAMAGTASLWILVHGEGADGSIQVGLDVLEFARWAWAPDCLAAQGGEATGKGILDWPYMFERLAENLDARPAAAQPDRSFTMEITKETAASDDRLQEALAVHPSLVPLYTVRPG